MLYLLQQIANTDHLTTPAPATAPPELRPFAVNRRYRADRLLPLASFAAADCARGANARRADRPYGFFAARDCTNEATWGVIRAALSDLTVLAWDHSDYEDLAAGLHAQGAPLPLSDGQVHEPLPCQCAVRV
ncbi:hypothetical protein ACFVUW_11985 [Streptomyces xiamenensis]|uniref:hypothetical protein n=1 Tax=Streptomyces xiamenensis TaxID=408015 RepID=UPI0036EF7E25